MAYLPRHRHHRPDHRSRLRIPDVEAPPRLREPKTYYGSPIVYGVKIKEPPGMPGYDRNRHRSELWGGQKNG